MTFDPLLVDETLRLLDVEVARLVPISVGKTLVYRLDDVALRIAPAGDENALGAQAILNLHELLIAGDVPVAPPVADLFLEANGLFVSGWKWVEDTTNGLVDGRTLGEVLRRLHRIDAASVTALPDSAGIVHRVISSTRSRLTSLHHFVDNPTVQRISDDLDFLANHPIWAELPVGCIHGDMSRANILIGADGSITMCDFERCGVGAPIWDVAGLCVAAASGVPWAQTTETIQAAHIVTAGFTEVTQLAALCSITFVASQAIHGRFSTHETTAFINWYVNGRPGLADCVN